MDFEEVAGWFAGRLRELRSVKGWTQGELAEKAGMAKARIANLEQCRTGPSWETVIRLCAALGVRSDEFQKPPADAESPGRGRPASSEPTAKGNARGRAK
jgi:transcriptional regulator with XRE-family HTH domain